MRPVPYQPSSYRYRASFKSRATAISVTLGIIALLIFLLVRLGMIPAIEDKQKPLVLQILPEPPPAPTPVPKVSKMKRVGGGAPRSAQAPTAKAAAAATVKAPKPPVVWNVLSLTKEEFAASDVSKMPSHSDDAKPAGDSGQGSGSGRNSGVDYGPGAGPGGAQLYNAEWYVRPSHAEMAYYLPKDGAPDGWGEVACKTAEQYRVEDCRELDETPGSGLARAVRQAAWQFKVRPPSLNGKPQIGVWVRIHFDFTRIEQNGR